jgi:hypothetical protein
VQGWWKRRSGYAKAVAVLAVVFGIGLGLCGLDSALLASLRNPNDEFGPNSFVGAVGAFVVLLSGAGLGVTVLVWVVASAVSAVSGNGSEPRRLPEDKGDEDRDNSR